MSSSPNPITGQDYNQVSDGKYGSCLILQGLAGIGDDGPGGGSGEGGEDLAVAVVG